MTLQTPPIIFESPDKGVTIYARQSGSTERMRISSNGNVGIGASNPKPKITTDQYNRWVDIERLAETNSAIKSALDKLMTTYYLSKENGNKET